MLQGQWGNDLVADAPEAVEDDGALAAVRRTPWRVRMSRVRSFSPDARTMARLHLMNLRTWRRDPAAVEAFDPAELSRVEEGLEAICEGRAAAPPVRHGLREIAAVRGSD